MMVAFPDIDGQEAAKQGCRFVVFLLRDSTRLQNLTLLVLGLPTAETH